MSLRYWWAWGRTLRQNPVYLREKGTWGNPNPFYATMKRYSPFLIMGAIVLGICAGANNPALLAGNEDLLIFYCLLCLPGMLLSMLTIFGTFMAPALTAPSISLEIDKGTWDILRMTPQPTGAILLAKLFGGLARLRIWPVLFLLSMFQGLLVTCIAAFGGGQLGLWGMVLGITTIFRPWLEIMFAAIAGMFISTWVRSATIALVGTYTAVVIIKLFNSSSAWLGIAALFGYQSNALFIGGTAGPTLIYMALILALMIGIVRRADKLSV
ncbi:MAG: hypothetical protein GY943_18365 [Chloroflexi bacterium]|nr:hypothetical protein [Chloroflexota bacterium]